MNIWKSRGDSSQRRERVRREEVRKGRIRRKKIRAREKAEKSWTTVVFFQCFVALEGLKVGSLKRRLRSHLARWEVKNCMPSFGAFLDVEGWDVQKVHGVAHFQDHVQSIVGICDVQKVHAVVVRSAFTSQNVQNTPRSEHFWKMRCSNSARPCGAKHISKSKRTEHTTSRALLEVQMSKRCTLSRPETYFEVKMWKAHHVWKTFGRLTAPR